MSVAYAMQQGCGGWALVHRVEQQHWAAGGGQPLAGARPRTHASICTSAACACRRHVGRTHGNQGTRTHPVVVPVLPRMLPVLLLAALELRHFLAVLRVYVLHVGAAEDVLLLEGHAGVEGGLRGGAGKGSVGAALRVHARVRVHAC